MRSSLKTLPAGAAVFVLLCAGLLRAESAEACSCLASNNCGSLAKSDAVFAATVEKVEYGSPVKLPSGEELIDQQRIVTLRDVISYRGEAPKTIVTGAGGGDCGYGFKPGIRYLVDGYRTRDGSISTSICSRTRPISGNEQLLDYVKSFGGDPTQTRLIGSVMAISEWKTHEPEIAPLVNRRVTISGPREVSVTTDADGQFSVMNLPPGTYRVSADIRRSDGYRDEEFTWAPSDQYACAEVRFIEAPGGAISGTIVDDKDAPRMRTSGRFGGPADVAAPSASLDKQMRPSSSHRANVRTAVKIGG
jgi:hypothetical protein